MIEPTNRDKMLTIPVSGEEMNIAKQEADKLGMSVSSFIRLLIKNWANGVVFEKKKAKADNHA